MAFGNGFFLFMLLAISWTFADARSLDNHETMVIPVERRVPRGESKTPAPLNKSEQLCAVCEIYSEMATSYLNDKLNQVKIIGTLHLACSMLHALAPKCIRLVDHYAQQIFSEVGKIQPEEFCKEVNLCEKTSLYLPEKDDSCTLCHRVVLETAAKLKDPDSELEMMQMLLKECNKTKRYAQECKRLVFQYVPLILANGEKFLESTDICSSIHACNANGEGARPAVTAEAFVLDE